MLHCSESPAVRAIFATSWRKIAACVSEVAQAAMGRTDIFLMRNLIAIKKAPNRFVGALPAHFGPVFHGIRSAGVQ